MTYNWYKAPDYSWSRGVRGSTAEFVVRYFCTSLWRRKRKRKRKRKRNQNTEIIARNREWRTLRRKLEESWHQSIHPGSEAISISSFPDKLKAFCNFYFSFALVNVAECLCHCSSKKIEIETNTHFLFISLGKSLFSGSNVLSACLIRGKQNIIHIIVYTCVIH